MGDKFAVIETPCVSKRKENIMAIINQSPKKVYEDKKSLRSIFAITEAINAARTTQSGQYALKFKLYEDEDMTLYELECNRLINSNTCAKEFSTISEFAEWYKSKAQEIIKEIKMDAEVQEYIRQCRKK